MPREERVGSFRTSHDGTFESLSPPRVALSPRSTIPLRIFPERDEARARAEGPTRSQGPFFEDFVHWIFLCYTQSYILLLARQMDVSKPVKFCDSALEDLRDFPPQAKRRAGYQIHRIQHGEDPDDWKSMGTIGAGVREIRIREEPGAFRVVYVAKFADAVYVLHCFQKKEDKTSKEDLNLARKRYRDLVREIGR
jgi:phage-related protein